MRHVIAMAWYFLVGTVTRDDRAWFSVARHTDDVADLLQRKGYYRRAAQLRMRAAGLRDRLGHKTYAFRRW